MLMDRAGARRAVRALVAAAVTVCIAAAVLPLTASAASADPASCSATPDAFMAIDTAPEFAAPGAIPISAGYMRLWDMGVAWRNLFPTSNTVDPAALSTLGQRITQVRSSGAKVLYVFGLTPQWAAANPTDGDPRFGAGSASPPQSVADFTHYVQTVVDTYGSQISAYELWNEANLQTFWDGTVQQLADMTAAAYTIIKAKYPNAIVLAPSTTTRMHGSTNRFLSGFIGAASTTSPAYAFDGYAIHTYPNGDQGPAARVADIQNWKASLAGALSNARAPASVLTRPIWDTEVNYGLAGPSPVPHVAYSDTEGAALLKQTYADSLSLGIAATFWYMFTPSPDSLLGVQFTPYSPAMLAQWSALRSQYTSAAVACASVQPSTSPSPASSSPCTDCSNAQSAPPAVPPVILPPSQRPVTNSSVTIIGNQPGSCTPTKTALGLSADCGTGITPPCSPTRSVQPDLTVKAGDVPGLYVQVIDGLIRVTNGGGSQVFTPGQFGYTPNFTQPPIILPSNPGMTFSPPPGFTIPGTSPATTCSSASPSASPKSAIRAKTPTASPSWAAGGTAGIAAGGFGPGKPITVYLSGVSAPLGRFAANAQGGLSAWVRIPAHTPVGANALQVNGLLANGTLASVTFGVTIRRGASTTLSITVPLNAFVPRGALRTSARTAVRHLLARTPVQSRCTVAGPFAQGAAVSKAINAYGLPCHLTVRSQSATVTVLMHYLS